MSTVAPPSASPGTIEEHFDTDGADLPGWTKGGAWRVADGRLAVSNKGGGDNTLTRTGLALPDSFRLSAQVALTPSDSLWSGLAAHVSEDRKDMFVFRIAFKGSGAHWQVLSKRGNRAWDVLASGPLATSFRADTAYAMSMTATGYGAYEFDLRDASGVALLRKSSTTDAAPQALALGVGAALTGGGAGLYSDAGSMQFDDVTLTASIFGTTKVNDTLADAAVFARDWTKRVGGWRVADGFASADPNHDRMVANTAVSLGSAFEATVEIDQSTRGTWSGIAFNATSDLSDRYVFRINYGSASRAPLWQLLRQTRGAEALLSTGSLPSSFAEGGPYLVGVRTLGLERVLLSVRDVSASPSSNLVQSDKRTVTLPASDRLIGGRFALYDHYAGTSFSNVTIATTSDKPAALTDRFDRADSTDMRSSWREGNHVDWGVRGGAAQVVTHESPGAYAFAIQQAVDLDGSAFVARTGVVIDDGPRSNSWSGLAVNLRNYALDQQTGSPQQYYVFRINPAKNYWQFLRVDAAAAPAERVVAQQPIPLGAGTHVLEVVSPTPGTFELSISRDGKRLIEPQRVTDTTPVAGGMVALVAQHQQQAFDDFTVISSHSSGAGRVTGTSCVGMTLAHNPVGQSVITRGTKQYVAYYGTDRYLRVASRTVTDQQATSDCTDGNPSDEWTTRTLDVQVPDDAHNYVTMAFDPVGQLHVIGNLHGGSLAESGGYYRTTVAGDVTSLVRHKELAPRKRIAGLTYPRFMTLPASGSAPAKLVINYRIGWSGGGSLVFDSYDPATQKWSELSTFTNYGDVPKPADITDVDDAYNAYLSFARGSDGKFRIAWVWRNSSDVRTTSRVSYAESADLVTWKTITGATLATPLSYHDASAGLIVDDVPEGLSDDPTVPGDQGRDNGLVSVALGLDSADNPVLGYTRMDAESRLQVYTSTFDRGAKRWNAVAVTDGPGVNAASGTGTVVVNANVGGLSAYGSSQPHWVTFNYDYGTMRNHVIVDSRTGTPVADSPGQAKLQPLDTYLPGWEQWFTTSGDINGTTDDGRSWSLAWYALRPNGDKIVTESREPAPPGALPSPVSLNPQPLWVYSTTR